MRNPRKLPDLSLIENRFQYNPETGQVFKDGQLCNAWNRSGYNVIRLGQTLQITAGRLGWYLYYRQDPGNRLVVHIDGCKSNNSINNLRLVNKRNKARVTTRDNK